MSHASDATAPVESMRVSTIELFFDLVFVFVVTQITHLVEHVHSMWELWRALLVLTLVWWMFAACSRFARCCCVRRPRCWRCRSA